MTHRMVSWIKAISNCITEIKYLVKYNEDQYLNWSNHVISSTLESKSFRIQNQC